MTMIILTNLRMNLLPNFAEEEYYKYMFAIDH